MSLKDKAVAVTGGAGFFGSFLCDELIRHEVGRLIIIDDFSLGKMINLTSIRDRDNVVIFKSDVSNLSKSAKIFDKENIDVVFNAAVIPLPMSLIKPKETIDKNILITSTVCELLLKNKFKTLIHISSSEAYGTAIYTTKSMDEEHPTYPTTPYAASKLACDHIVLSFAKTFGLDVAIARPFNMYGPRQNDASYAGVVPITIKKILNGDSPVIYGDGLQTRDYSYVEDVASVVPKFYLKQNTRNKVINVATGKEISIKYLIETIAELMEYKGEIKYLPPRPGDVRRHVGDITLAQRLLGDIPKTDLLRGLQLTIDWYRKSMK